MGLRISRDVASRIVESGLAIDPTRPLQVRSAGEARELAAALSAASDPPVTISAGRLRGAIELARVLRRRLADYFEAHESELEELLSRLEERMGRESLRTAFELFEHELTAVPSEATDRESKLSQAPKPWSVLADSMLFYALGANPATAPVCRALRGEALGSDPVVEGLLAGLGVELAVAPPLDDRTASLRESLLATSDLAESLPDQLRLVLDEWQDLEAPERSSFVAVLDLIAEEESPRFPPGPGPIELPDYEELQDESPRYSRDLHWMEPLALIAKNSYVWLEQLSRRYGREITTLDQIPDRELESLSRQGVSGLWLIGIWARSRASAEIKRLMGNPQALASAYSVRDYEIATELGGPPAAAELGERAARHGIRLAADMVPNHMGIDSRWLIEHPERFLSVGSCPFPSYTFDGPDLSSDAEVGIYLEDHYYDRTDAAVVFKRVDRRSGETRYVYHGNDGTSTPWNDTAQLDYLNPRTREAVIRTILGVAESFPIIRFDAAMTLARRHVRRLWFPEPGSGGAIPSRSDYALSKEAFDQALPTEFWREVVARVADERPDTLLLAEAFWLMESYFVRSLGMHRVYNSAFMHLLRDGDTAKLRSMIEETLAFDPEILKRFVNFLSNPDEDTAIDQFGNGDRYFGACMVLATLPGLPLFAHGQFEGLREKYGMEFRRPQLEEAPDVTIERRHRRQIFPLLRRRGQFAGVELFRLLPFEGTGSDQVLAYANGSETERTLVVFNNSADEARGALRGVEGLLEPESDAVYRFRDLATGVKFLCEARAAVDAGLELQLEPWEARVLVDFRPVLKTVEESYRALSRRLAGRGIENVELELELLEVLPLVESAAAYLEVGKDSEATLAVLEGAARAVRPRLDAEELRRDLERSDRCDDLAGAVRDLPWPSTERMQDERRRVVSALAHGGADLARLRSLAVCHALHAALGGSLSRKLWPRALQELTGLTLVDDPSSDPKTDIALGLALTSRWLQPTEPPGRAELLSMLNTWVESEDAARLLGINRFDGEDWVRKENLEALLRWRGLTGLCGWLLTESRVSQSEKALGWIEAMALAKRIFEEAGYSIGRVRAMLRAPRRASAGGGGGARPTASRGRRRRRRRTKRPR